MTGGQLVPLAIFIPGSGWPATFQDVALDCDYVAEQTERCPIDGCGPRVVGC